MSRKQRSSHAHKREDNSVWVSMIQLSVTIIITPRSFNSFPCGIIREGLLQLESHSIAPLIRSSELGLLVLDGDITASSALVGRPNVVGDLLVLGLLEGGLMDC